MKIFREIIDRFKKFWKDHICDVVPEEYDDIF